MAISNSERDEVISALNAKDCLSRGAWHFTLISISTSALSKGWCGGAWRVWLCPIDYGEKGAVQGGEGQKTREGCARSWCFCGAPDSGSRWEILAQPLCRNMSGILMHEFFSILPAIFPEDFWHSSKSFSNKNDENKSGDKSGNSKKSAPNPCFSFVGRHRFASLLVDASISMPIKQDLQADHFCSWNFLRHNPESIDSVTWMGKNPRQIHSVRSPKRQIDPVWPRPSPTRPALPMRKPLLCPLSRIKGSRKNNKLNSMWPKMARLGPPFWPQNSPEKFVWAPFLRHLPGNSTWTLLGASNVAFWMGGKKFMLKKWCAYDAEIPWFISIVRHTGCPVIWGMDWEPLWILSTDCQPIWHWQTAESPGEVSVVSVSQRTKHGKLKKIEAKFGTKILKIRGTFRSANLLT